MHVILYSFLLYIDFYYSLYIQYKDTLDAWIFFCVTWFDEFRLRMETKKALLRWWT